MTIYTPLSNMTQNFFTVKIFRTNIEQEEKAKDILLLLTETFPHYEMNFDLNDEDNILRIKARTINSGKVTNKIEKLGFKAEVLV